MSGSRILRSAAVLVAVVAALCASGSAKADAVADFYKGNTITLLLGTGPGATYDLYARILARHLARHIPGEPAVVVSYMPGAGGLNMFNRLYNLAPKDGTVIDNTFGTLPVNQLFKPDAVRYDARKLNWLGSVSRDITVLAVNADAPATTLEAAQTTEIVVGSICAGNGAFYFPSLVNTVLSTRIKIISGYPSGNDIYKAMESREVHGYAPVWLSLATVKADWLRDRKVALVAQSGTRRHQDLPNVPLLYETAQTEEHRQMVLFFSATAPIDHVSAVPPERVAALANALAATVSDPAYRDAMRDRKLTVEPSSQAEVVAAVDLILDTPKGRRRAAQGVLRRISVATSVAPCARAFGNIYGTVALLGEPRGAAPDQT